MTHVMFEEMKAITTEANDKKNKVEGLQKSIKEKERKR